jgi:PAS domain S-box-containing protein
MTVQQRIRWLALTAVLIWAAVSSLWLVEDHFYTSAMHRRTDVVASRSVCLADINNQLGYGGLIHCMKNFVLRGDREYIDRFNDSHAAAQEAIRRYQELPELTPTELAALRQVQTVIDNYRAAFDLAVTLRTDPATAGLDAREVDARVRVDDSLAFASISVLAEHRTQLNLAISRDIQRIRDRLGLTKMSVAVFGVAVFLVLSRKLTRPIVRPVITIDGETEVDAASAAELIVQHAELRSILDALPAHVYFKDTEDRILNLNKAAADAIGLPLSEIIGSPRTDFVPPEDADKLFAEDMAIIESGVPKRGINEVQTTRSGETRYLVTDKIPLPGPDGTIDRLLAIATDVTDIRNAEARIEDLNRMLDESLRPAGQGGWSWDIEDDTVRFNETWYTMLGYEPFELPMEFATWEKLLHPEDHAYTIAALVRHMEGRSDTFDCATRMKCKDGSWKWIRTVGQVWQRDDKGEATRISGIHIDVNNERRLAEQLKQKNKEMERLLYSASHDLKSPIVTVMGFLSHLDRAIDEGNPTNAKRYIGILKDAGRQMQSNVEDILEISRMGRMTVHPSRVVIPEVVREVKSVLATRIDETKAQICCDLEIEEVWCDRRHMVSVLHNLVGNALKYACEADPLEITIRSRSNIGGVRIDVIDNGPGIDPSYANKIFDLFERLSSNGEGSGVGLAIVRRIAEVWGGNAWLEPSETGACFSITMAPAAITTLAEAKASTESLPKKESNDDVHRGPTDSSTLLTG